jgi:lipopolysaccharide transport protein LptA
MDVSFHKVVLLAAALAATASAAGQERGEPLPIDLDAELVTIDGQTNLVHILAPKITQGAFSIEAGDALATDIGFEQSEWRFSGGVRIVADTAVLESDTAVFTFDDYELQLGELTGNPASFTDRSAPATETARGSANKISYDYVNRTLRMSQNARIVKGPNEIVGCDLIYDFTEERVTSGSADCGEPFRLRVLPRSNDGAANSAADP